MANTKPLERDDIQGIVLSGYVHLRKTAYLLLSIDATRRGDARAWLGAIADEVTTARKKREGDSLNVALTFTAFQKLGLDDAMLATFPIAFSEGMASKRRAYILTDNELDDSSKWRWGGEHHPVDVLLMAFAETPKHLEEFLATLRAGAAAHGLTEVIALDAQIYDDRNEHFGFSDGIAQPVLASQRKDNDGVSDENVVSDGEFVLGYRNAYGFDSDTPDLGPDKQLGKNGTYLVFRHTTQDVAGFWHFVDDAAKNVRIDGELLAAKIVGRWKSGAPLVLAPDKDPDPDADPEKMPTDAFGYASDPKGLACPFGAHIRRSNPRDGMLTSGTAAESVQRAARHRLLRRGRSYGPRIGDPRVDDKVERGLHFICLCADIERQFEFVQQTWLNNPVFGQLVGEVDPLVGAQTAGDAVFTIQAEPVRKRVQNMQCFVTLRGGAYFFLPSIKALRWLGRG
ncbi:MAG: Dyp-type peroxidase [Candidatus Eremiobacteraeota bacterium]|nr:Dyp-type peroxidase [Candidatus Eremiobacteraeota bacterium]